MRGKSQILALAGVAVGVGAFAWWWWSRRQEAGAAGEELQPIEITAQRLPDPFGFTDAPAPIPERSLVGDAVDWIGATAVRVGALVTSRGYRNNNPGNIRTLPAGRAWNGQIGDDGGYGVYDTPQHGTRALGRQLLKYAAGGLVTVRGIITRWAPASDNNNVAAYVSDVARALGVGPDEALDVRAVLPELARAIARHENGYVAADYDWQWVYL